MQAAYGTGGHCCHAAVCRQGQTAHGSDLHHSLTIMYGSGVWNRTVGQDNQRREEKLSQHSSPASRDCSSGVLYGTLGYFHPVYSMLPNCAGSTDARTWRLADVPKEAAILIRGSRGGRRPKVEHGLVGNVKSITEQIQHTEYCQGDCTGKGQQPSRRVAPPQSASLSARHVVSLRVDTG
jgi:hypothetical protein